MWLLEQPIGFERQPHSPIPWATSERIKRLGRRKTAQRGASAREERATSLATNLTIHGVALRLQCDFIWISEGCPVSILVHHTYLLDKDTAGEVSPKLGLESRRL